MDTLETLIREITAQLAARGCGEAHREASRVVAYGLRLKREDLFNRYAESLHQFSEKSMTHLRETIRRRLLDEPISRIRGQRDFWKSSFSINPHVLDPRPETEGLIELALDFFRPPTPPPQSILELGVGSGCLLLSLLQEFPKSHGVGIDLSEDALTLARHNGERLGLNDRCILQRGNWMEGLSGTFDLIVSNPPYIPTFDIPTLDPEVRNFDPHLALDGGVDGLEAYRALIPQAARHLSPHGVLLLEMGFGQESAVGDLLKTSFPHVACLPDLSGVIRYGKGWSSTPEQSQQID